MCEGCILYIWWYVQHLRQIKSLRSFIFGCITVQEGASYNILIICASNNILPCLVLKMAGLLVIYCFKSVSKPSVTGLKSCWMVKLSKNSENGLKFFFLRFQWFLKNYLVHLNSKHGYFFSFLDFIFTRWQMASFWLFYLKHSKFQIFEIKSQNETLKLF